MPPRRTTAVVQISRAEEVRSKEQRGKTNRKRSFQWFSELWGLVLGDSSGGCIVIPVISVFLFSLCYVLFLRLPEKKRRHCGGTWWVWLQSVVRRMLLLLEGSPRSHLKITRVLQSVGVFGAASEVSRLLPAPFFAVNRNAVASQLVTEPCCLVGNVNATLGEEGEGER